MKNFRRKKSKKSNLIVPVKKAAAPVKPPQPTILDVLGSDVFWNRVQTNHIAGIENSLKRLLSDSAERVTQISIREMVEAATYKFPTKEVKN